MRNLFSRLRKVEEFLEEIPDGVQTLHFLDGSTKEIDVKKLFNSIMEGKPNKDVQFLLDELASGNPDENGLVYQVEAYNLQNDPEAMAELWRDEDELSAEQQTEED